MLLNAFNALKYPRRIFQLFHRFLIILKLNLYQIHFQLNLINHVDFIIKYLLPLNLLRDLKRYPLHQKLIILIIMKVILL